jgi:hypothetical protein
MWKPKPRGFLGEVHVFERSHLDRLAALSEWLIFPKHHGPDCGVPQRGVAFHDVHIFYRPIFIYCDNHFYVTLNVLILGRLGIFGLNAAD